jgi:hypothetical protein
VEQKWNTAKISKKFVDCERLTTLPLRPFKALVVGSSPTQPTILLRWLGFTFFAVRVAVTTSVQQRTSIADWPSTVEVRCILLVALANRWSS